MNRLLPGPTWISSHIYGQGIKNIARKLAYYHIPKCASMWMRSCLSMHGLDRVQDSWTPTYFTEEPLDDYRKIIVLRDPVQRWISACPASDTIGSISQDKIYIDEVFDRIKEWQYDEHVAPQFDFINGLNLSNAIWFFCDGDLSANIENFFLRENFENYQVPPIINQQSHDPQTVHSAGIWQILLQMPAYLEKFQAAYQKDYDLINSVEFYRYQ